MRQPSLFFVLLLACASIAAASADVNRDDVLRITGNIVCNCGCPPTVVRSCSCERAAEMTREVEGLLAEGKTDEEVYQHYVAQFGPVILAAPKAQGFNLLGWALPFVALALGAGAVTIAYRRLKTKHSAEEAAPQPPKGSEDKYRKILEDVLSED